MKVVIFILLFMVTMLHCSFAKTVGQSDFSNEVIAKGVVIFKVKSSYKYLCTDYSIESAAFEKLISIFNVSSIRRKFPFANFENVTTKNGKPVDLSLIYEIHFSPEIDIKNVLQKLRVSGLIEYAEPIFLQQLYYVPSDSGISNQYFLNNINAFAAWDEWKGDTNTVIGIVDTGTDWDHPDLAGNIHYNYLDTLDGLDNDNDGYVDNFRGWDISMDDNNPGITGGNDHGSHVSGCAAAVTDNLTGVASPAFNCKFLPVKVSLDVASLVINNGYDGLVYAANHGCKVINCSWGRGGNPSEFEADVISYCTINKDALVVAAAGNNSAEQSNYPASYPNVLSVAATDASDYRASFSNYGSSIDVGAPGDQIYSTIYDDAYAARSGTSMSTPIASGCAAMVRSKFPWMNAIQAGEQLRTTCDDIYSLTGNAGLTGKLGKGRVNLLRALTDSVSPGVMVSSVNITDGNDSIYLVGDTLRFVVTFKNLLRPTRNFSCTMTSSLLSVPVIQGNFSVGVLNTMDTISNFSVPFEAIVESGTPINQTLFFLFSLSDGSWSDYYSVNVPVNIDFINYKVNKIATSITSKSLFGFNGSSGEGIGFVFKDNPNMVFEMGLMAGVSPTAVSDNVRNNGSTADQDFYRVIRVDTTQPGILSELDAQTVFSDSAGSADSPLTILVKQEVLGWNSTADENYIITRYRIKNTGFSTLYNLYVGMFSDWDIGDFNHNKCATDQTRQLGYAWCSDSGGLYGGIKLLSSDDFHHYAFDNATDTSGGINIADGFTQTEKFASLSSSRFTAGQTTTEGNDIIDVVSSGPHTLFSGDSIEVAFALIAGEDLNSIMSSSDAAQLKYNSIPKLDGGSVSESALNIIYPNPSAALITIGFSTAGGYLRLEVFDVLGKKMKVLADTNLQSGHYTLRTDLTSLSSGIYYLRMATPGFAESKPLSIVKY